jgi:methionyl-tRNA formyltransferase
MNSTLLVLLRTKKIPEAPSYIDHRETVVGCDSAGVIIKAGDATLKVSRVADWDADANEPVDPRVPRYSLGTTFGLNVNQEIQRMAQRIRNRSSQNELGTAA